MKKLLVVWKTDNMIDIEKFGEHHKMLLLQIRIFRL